MSTSTPPIDKNGKLGGTINITSGKIDFTISKDTLVIHKGSARIFEVLLMPTELLLSKADYKMAVNLRMRLTIFLDAINDIQKDKKLEVKKIGFADTIGLANTIIWMNSLKERALLKEKLKMKKFGVHDVSICYLRSRQAVLEGKIHYYTGKYELAINSFVSATAYLGYENQQTLDAWFNMGLSFYKTEAYDKALSYFSKVLSSRLSSSPREARAYLYIGKIFYRHKDKSKAIEYFNEALEIDPKLQSIFYNIGIYYYDSNNYHKAIKNFDQALQLTPGNADTWYYKGKSLYELNRYGEAMICMNNARRIDTKYANTWYDKKVASQNSFIRIMNFSEIKIAMLAELFLASIFINEYYSSTLNSSSMSSLIATMSICGGYLIYKALNLKGAVKSYLVRSLSKDAAIKTIESKVIPSTTDTNKIEIGLEGSLRKAVNFNKLLKSQETKTFIKWHEEQTEEDISWSFPKATEIFDDQILEEVKHNYSSLFLKEITKKVHSIINDEGNDIVRKNVYDFFSVEFSLMPLKFYFEMAKIINADEVSKVRFMMSIETSIKIENLIISGGDTAVTRIEIRKLTALPQIYLTEILVHGSQINRVFKPKKNILNLMKPFEVSDLLLSRNDINVKIQIRSVGTYEPLPFGEPLIIGEPYEMLVIVDSINNNTSRQISQKSIKINVSLSGTNYKIEPKTQVLNFQYGSSSEPVAFTIQPLTPKYDDNYEIKIFFYYHLNLLKALLISPNVQQEGRDWNKTNQYRVKFRQDNEFLPTTVLTSSDIGLASIFRLEGFQ